MSMKQILLSGAVAVLVLAPISAFAVDRVQGIVQRVDTSAYEFTIAVDGTSGKPMTFKVEETMFDELELDVDDELSVEYDAGECAAAPGCVAKASKVERRS